MYCIVVLFKNLTNEHTKKHTNIPTNIPTLRNMLPTRKNYANQRSKNLRRVQILLLSTQSKTADFSSFSTAYPHEMVEYHGLDSSVPYTKLFVWSLRKIHEIEELHNDWKLKM